MGLDTQTARILRFLRYRANITQKELAKKSNLSLYTIKKIEGGIVNPKLETIYKISKALDINPYIFTDTLWQYWNDNSINTLSTINKNRLLYQKNPENKDCKEEKPYFKN